jgi:O-antigen ligase
VTDAAARRRHVDVTTLLTVAIVLNVAIPSRLILGPLGASGTPVSLLGMLCLLWWFATVLSPRLGLARGPQPVRTAVLLLVMAIAASYVSAMIRPIPPDEATSAERGLLMTAAWVGFALLAADGIGTADRLETLMRRLAGAGAALAAVGVLQFFTGFDPVAHIHLPGLVANGDLVAIQERSGFRRVAGTATHPIEFGVTLALILPIAIAMAMNARADVRRTAWAKVWLIAVALPMSLSRSGFVVAGIALLLFVPTWTKAQRRRAMVLVPVPAGARPLAVPGLLGTVKSLFLNISSDPSYTARTQRYGIAGHFISQRPLFGRGFFTFLPKNYLILDNAYLGAAIEIGIVGVLALLIVFAVGVVTARGARRLSASDEQRRLAQALAGSIAGAAASLATYDAFAFPMSTVVTFVLIGAAGATWRIAGGEERDLQALLSTALSRRERMRPAAPRLVGAVTGPAR